MSTGADFDVDPWQVREGRLDLDVLAQVESVFALSNGHIGLRANLDEGEPHATLGTYLNGFYEQRPLPSAEAGYGDPEDGQTMINVTDGKVIRLLVEDEPFDLRYGTLVSHERVLDLQDGVLRRDVVWRSPAGRTVRVRSTRLVSFSQRAVAAVNWSVQAVDGPVRVVVQSELVANEPDATATDDPRAAAALCNPLESEEHGYRDHHAMLVHRTRSSGLRMAAGMDHVITGDDPRVTMHTLPDLARATIVADLAEDEPLEVVKYLAYGWSARRSLPAVRAQVAGALAQARVTGWDDLLASQREYLDAFWARADVQVQGDDALQQALRFAIFHVLQAGARVEQRAIPAKGLTGAGYDGHAFWDTETYVLPVLSSVHPEAVGDLLRWRHSTLEAARERARELGHHGASFPWRTIAGQECSAYWPAGTAAFHINADIACAVLDHVQASSDEDFERDVGLELLVETARLWISLGHHDGSGCFCLDGVTGPDEYSAIADNNVYTNLMAQRNLRGAADAAGRWPQAAGVLDVDDEEVAGWRAAAEAMRIPYDSERGLHPQSERFLDHERWDFDSMRADQYPLMLHFPYVDLYRKQVVKQADLVMAMHHCGEAFTREQKVRNFDYYEQITVRDSSLSACTQSVIAAEVGHLDLAFRYLRNAAFMDLHDLHHNTDQGLHIAALAGAWIATVDGLGGMRDYDAQLSFAPRLPDALEHLRFGVTRRGVCVQVEVAPEAATYTLLNGESIDLHHHGEPFTLTAAEAVVLDVPALEEREPPSQPRHRVPQADPEPEQASAGTRA